MAPADGVRLAPEPPSMGKVGEQGPLQLRPRPKDGLQVAPEGDAGRPVGLGEHL